MFTKQHYKAIAEIIEDCHYGLNSCNADYYNAGRFDAARLIAIGLSDYFVSDNSYFDHDKFMKACGFEEG